MTVQISPLALSSAYSFLARAQCWCWRDTGNALVFALLPSASLSMRFFLPLHVCQFKSSIETLDAVLRTSQQSSLFEVVVFFSVDKNWQEEVVTVEMKENTYRWSRTDRNRSVTRWTWHLFSAGIGEKGRFNRWEKRGERTTQKSRRKKESKKGFTLKKYSFASFAHLVTFNHFARRHTWERRALTPFLSSALFRQKKVKKKTKKLLSSRYTHRHGREIDPWTLNNDDDNGNEISCSTNVRTIRRSL